MTPTRRVYVVETRKSDLALSEIGDVSVREPGMNAVERARGGHSRDPHRLNYRRFADSVLASSVEPELGPSRFSTMSVRDRGRLLLAVVRLRDAETAWRQLYGSHLSLDERFFVVMRWADARDRDALFERLREARRRNAVQVAKPGSVGLRKSRLGIAGLSGYVGVVGQIERMMEPFRAMAKFRAPELGMGPLLPKNLGAGAGFVRPLDITGIPSVKLGIGAHMGFTGFSKGLDFTKSQVSPFIGVKQQALFKSDALKAAIGLSGFGRFKAGSLFTGLNFSAELAELIAEVGPFWDELRKHPLWFLLSAFGLRDARPLVGLSVDEVEEVLLDSLEEVVRDGELTEALREIVREAPYPEGLAREWLIHGLEHAERGEWVHAVLPLVAGLEGALAAAAVARSLIAGAGGKYPPAEKVVKKLLPVGDDYRTFLILRVYGGRGNTFRHGRADSGERRQALHSIVALVGWADAFLELSGMRVLGELLAERLPEAVERLEVEQRLLSA